MGRRDLLCAARAAARPYHGRADRPWTETFGNHLVVSRSYVDEDGYVLVDPMPPSPPLSSSQHDITPFELGTRLLTKMYESLVTNRLYDTRFQRGRRPSDDASDNRDEEGRQVRSLATAYFDAPSTDSWNVLAGAIDIARVWAFSDVESPHSSCSTRANVNVASLDRDTRMKLAVCLTVAWKFARGMNTAFYRDFEAFEPPTRGGYGDGRFDDCWMSRRTLELGFVAYLVLYPDEQEILGDWTPKNVWSLRALQSCALELETKLVCDVHTFPCLARNAQVRAELFIEHLLLIRAVTIQRGMQLRALLPFFVRGSMFKRFDDFASPYIELLCDDVEYEDENNDPGPIGLVCAAWLCMRHSGLPARDLDNYGTLFDETHEAVARRLIDNLLCAIDVDPLFYSGGCYGDVQWHSYNHCTVPALKNALMACAPPKRDDFDALTKTFVDPTERTDTASPTSVILLRCVSKVCSWS